MSIPDPGNDNLRLILNRGPENNRHKSILHDFVKTARKIKDIREGQYGIIFQSKINVFCDILGELTRRRTLGESLTKNVVVECGEARRVGGWLISYVTGRVGFHVTRIGCGFQRQMLFGV